MERIVIEVADDTAKRWRLTSQKRKEEISQRISLALAEELTESKEELKRFLDEVGVKMKARGLTEEKLNDILKDEA